MSKVFPRVLDATGQTAEVCAVDLRHPTLLMVYWVGINFPGAHKAASPLSGLSALSSSGAWLG